MIGAFFRGLAWGMGWQASRALWRWGARIGVGVALWTLLTRLLINAR